MILPKKGLDNSETDNGTLEELLEIVDRSDSSGEVLSGVRKISELYFEGLLDHKIPEGTSTDKPTESLSSLMWCGVLAAEAVYLGNEDLIPFVKQVLWNEREQLISTGLKRKSKENYLSNFRPIIRNFGQDIKNFIAAEGKIDTIVCITSGGFEPAFIAGVFAEGAEILPMRCSRYTKADSNVRVPKAWTSEYLASKIQGKRVLIVDDVICSGVTLRLVMDYLSVYKPKEIYGTSVELVEYENGLASNIEEMEKYADTKIYKFSERKRPRIIDRLLSILK